MLSQHASFLPACAAALRLARKALLLCLVGLLMIAPVLHAHRGASAASGWHWPALGLPAVQVEAKTSANAQPVIFLASAQEQESPEVDVPPLKLPEDVLGVPQVLFALLFLLCLQACARQFSVVVQRFAPSSFTPPIWRRPDAAPPVLAPPYC